jgi:hypothetical protein
MMSAGVGGSAGAVIGSKIPGKNKKKSTIVGALVGAAVSGLAGYLFHRSVEKREDKIRRDTLFNLDRFDVSTPQGFGFSTAHGVTAPKIESEWIPTRVQGKKLIEGHKVWLITDETKWVPNVGKPRNKK